MATSDTRIELSPEQYPTTAETNISHQLRPLTRKRQLWVLISSYLTICITIGLNQSYGVLQRAYVSDEYSILQSSERGNSAMIAFIGTLGTGLTWAGSIFINPLLERIAAKYITVPGVVLMSLGFGLASLATQVGKTEQYRVVLVLTLYRYRICSLLKGFFMELVPRCCIFPCWQSHQNTSIRIAEELWASSSPELVPAQLYSHF